MLEVFWHSLALSKLQKMLRNHLYMRKNRQNERMIPRKTGNFHVIIRIACTWKEDNKLAWLLRATLNSTSFKVMLDGLAHVYAFPICLSASDYDDAIFKSGAHQSVSNHELWRRELEYIGFDSIRVCSWRNKTNSQRIPGTWWNVNPINQNDALVKQGWHLVAWRDAHLF